MQVTLKFHNRLTLKGAAAVDHCDAGLTEKIMCFFCATQMKAQILPQIQKARKVGAFGAHLCKLP